MVCSFWNRASVGTGRPNQRDVNCKKRDRPATRALQPSKHEKSRERRQAGDGIEYCLFTLPLMRFSSNGQLFMRGEDGVAKHVLRALIRLRVV